MARRISGVGRVTVSLRRSTTFNAGPAAREFIAITGSVSVALKTQPPLRDLNPKVHLRSSTKTSFETLSREGASRTTGPFHSTNPEDASGSKREANFTA